MTQSKLNSKLNPPYLVILVSVVTLLNLGACALKQISFDQGELIPLDGKLASLSFNREGKRDGKRADGNSKLKRGPKPTRMVSHRSNSGKLSEFSRVNDPLIRNEIFEEMTQLDQLEHERAKLRAEFKDQPLLGPITIQHLDDILVAEFDANRLQAQYLAHNQEQTRIRQNLAAPASPIANKPPPSLASAANHDSHSITVSSGGTARATIAETSVGTSAMSTGTAASLTGRKGPRGIASATKGNRGERIVNDLPPQPNAAAAGIFVETRREDGLEPARKMASRVLRGDALRSLSSESPNQIAVEPGVISETSATGIASLNEPPTALLKKLNSLEDRGVELSQANETPLIFDIPMTYNARVSFWIRYFQTEGRSSFRGWLERSSKFIPLIQYELTRAGLPQDLVYLAMIESGFSTSASSHAAAIGLWQFIEPTGRRYGLKIDWWLDERRDFIKSTRAAINYMGDLYQQFNSWYLVAASYNMGENGVRRLMTRYKTNNFWELADRGVMPNETTNYVPKIIAATLIAKAPALYGFRELNYQMPVAFEYFNAPGGTDISNLAQYLGVSRKYLKDLNPELTKGFVPKGVSAHRIRIPKGALLTVSQYVKLQAGENVTF